MNDLQFTYEYVIVVSQFTGDGDYPETIEQFGIHYLVRDRDGTILSVSREPAMISGDSVADLVGELEGIVAALDGPYMTLEQVNEINGDDEDDSEFELDFCSDEDDYDDDEED